MLTLHQSRRIVVCISLVLIVLLVISCAPAATPTPTLPPTAAPTTPALPAATPTTPALPTTETTTPPTPPSAEELAKQGFALPELPRITCEQLRQMMSVKDPEGDRGVDFVLVDARSVEWGYNMGHLPGAISIPNQPEPPYTEEWITMQLEGLPTDRLIIFYCCDAGDEESASLAEKLIQLRAGDTENIKVLWKGFSGWLQLGYPTSTE